MTTYENAPATLMLATNCMICRRPLVDAISVEAGIGPECRKRHGYDKGNVQNRKAANVIIHEIATSQYSPDFLLVKSDALRELGFEVLANVMLKRNSSTILSRLPDGKSVLVNTPYDINMVAEFRKMGAQSKYRSPENKKGFQGFIVPLTKWTVLLAALKTNFPKTLATGDKGSFIL